MTTDETRGAIDATGLRLSRMLDVCAEEGTLGVEYSRRVLHTDRVISRLLFDGVPAERLAKILGSPMALIEERAGRHRQLAG